MPQIRKEWFPMKTLIKQLTTLLLVFAMALALSSIAFATDFDTPEPGIVEEEPYTIISTCDTRYSQSGNTANCSASISATGASSVSITMTLQKKSGGTYSNVKTWTASANGTSTSIRKTKAISSGSTYRLKVKFTAKKGGSTESDTVYRYK